MIGFITGGVLLLIIVILAILCFFNRRKTRATHNVVQLQTPTRRTPDKHGNPSGMYVV